MKTGKPIAVLLALALCLTVATASAANAAEENTAFDLIFDTKYDSGENGSDDDVTEDGSISNEAATRAMAVTMLWRMAGMPDAEAKPSFTDINNDAWYADAVAWAVSEGIVNGISDTEFSPDAPVTREQLAAILYRYAQRGGEGFTGAWAFPLSFPDAADVSEYAYEPLCWMTMKDIITGKDDGTLAPKANATRAQVNAILMRFAADSLSYEEFKALDAEKQIQAFSAMTGAKIYELVKNSNENWPVTSYDLISPENAKETIVLYVSNGDPHFNLAWPVYGGFLAESIASIEELSGKIDVSRDGGDGGYSMSYDKNEDGSFPNDSQRSVPKTSATVRAGVLDVDRYKKAVEIVINGKSDKERINELIESGYTEEVAARFLSDQAAWLLRDEVSGADNIADGAKLAGHDVKSGYGYYGITAPWTAGDLDLAGGGGQLCTVFSWGTLCESGLISDIITAEIN
ncbi:MAG: S-layer homology domain-containing protein [Clostridia bacterium]|nr:S-layer homology domain-containing protein [Clostridia bacterium]